MQYPQLSYTPVKFWDCGLGDIRGHRHSTQQLAKECRDKRHEYRHTKDEKESSLLHLRRIMQSCARDCGLPVREVARRFGVSPSTVYRDRKWCLHYAGDNFSRAIVSNANSPLFGLPKFVAQALMDRGVSSLEGALHALLSRSLPDGERLQSVLLAEEQEALRLWLKLNPHPVSRMPDAGGHLESNSGD